MLSISNVARNFLSNVTYISMLKEFYECLVVLAAENRPRALWDLKAQNSSMFRMPNRGHKSLYVCVSTGLAGSTRVIRCLRSPRRS